MRALVHRFVFEEDAQDLVEYALLCAAIALSSIAAVSALGTTIRGVFITVSDQLAVE